MTPKDTSSASYPEFGRLLNNFLGREDRKPADLARHLGVEPSTVGRWLNDGRRPGDPETVGRICDFLRIKAAQDRHAFFKAAGYAYIERPISDGQAVDPDDLAAYLEIVRTKHRFLETRGYRNLAELSGPPIRLPVLDDGGRSGVYTPLRYDLQLSQEAARARRSARLANRQFDSAEDLERDLSRTNIDLRDVLAEPWRLA